MTRIKFIVPAISDDFVSSALRTLTRAIAAKTGEQLAGGLGGDDGYGFHYDNNTFTMWPFYWGDCDCGWRKAEAEWCDAHDHTDRCYQSELERRGAFDHVRNGPFDYMAVAREWGLPEVGSAVHCTCGRDTDLAAWTEGNPHPKTCSEERPNFLYKPTGAEVRWYKYIGRGMELEGELPVDFLTVCLASLEVQR